MNRKSLIACLAVLAAMAVGVAIAVAVLYYDPDRQPPVEARYELLQAIPSNAVVVGCLSNVSDISSDAFAGFKFPAALSEAVADGILGTLSQAPMAFALHYSGKLTPLYVFDVGSSSPTPSQDAEALMELGRRQGLQVRYQDCSTVLEDSDLASRSIVVMAETDALVKSSLRHLEQSLSVMAASGFAKAADAAVGADVLFVSYAQAKPLFTSLFNRKYFNDKYGKDAGAAYSAKADYVCSMADWGVFSIGSDDRASLSLDGQQIYADDASDFMAVLSRTASSVPSVSQVLPSYTFFSLTLPMSSYQPYVSAYKTYLDSKQRLADYNRIQKLFDDDKGISPEEVVRKMDPREVATAAFGTAESLMRVNLVKFGRKDTLGFGGPGLEYAFPGCLSAVFGDFFALEDESCCTFVDGWLVTGSRAAVTEYTSGRATDYTLFQYMADAGRDDLMGPKPVAAAAYLDLGVDAPIMGRILNKEIKAVLQAQAAGAEYRPMVMTAYSKGGAVATDLSAYALSMQRMKAPEFERDTVVNVPAGPFKVRNSGTGRTNLFYQNPSGAICLKEEDGKGIWGVPFGQPLCGTAQTIDYYANGKLQILFGAGSKVYLIDRLGRFVNGFPVDLGKDILLGPEAYDFNGAGAYNIMVLHKDNTIEMYNLKGRKPASWKGITCDKTIKELPERIEVGGNTFWVVRTSIQTLIYPFAGGEPLTRFEGQQMILPDSRVDVVDHVTVQAQCYDGQVRTIKLK